MYYLFHGTDEFSMSEELARLRAEASFGLNVDVFSGADAEISSIQIVCETLPFLSDRRLVVVDGLPRRKQASADTDRPEDDSSRASERAKAVAPTRGKRARSSGPDPKVFIEGLAAYVARLPETTVLVVAVEETLEPTHALVVAAHGRATVRTFVAPRGAQLESWLLKRAQARGIHLEPEAAGMLAAAGADLRALAGELEKLAVYVGDGEHITSRDVSVLTTQAALSRIFDLTDALARRDRARALSLLHELLEAGESPVGIVAFAAMQTRALIQVQALAERGMRAAQIAQSAGLAPYVVEKTLPLARAFSASELEGAHRQLLEIDAALKQSKLTPDAALDLFVVAFGRP